MNPEVKESTVYENCIGVVNEPAKPASLSDFLGIEDTPDDDKEWTKHWVGMPEFTQEDSPPHRKLIINFRSQEDFDEFSKLLEGDQKLTDKTKSIWYPKLEKDQNSLKRWIETD